MVGTDYVKNMYSGDWTDFVDPVGFAFNDGKKQAIKEILEALGEEFLQSDDSFAETIDRMKEEIKWQKKYSLTRNQLLLM